MTSARALVAALVGSALLTQVALPARAGAQNVTFGLQAGAAFPLGFGARDFRQGRVLRFDSGNLVRVRYALATRKALNGSLATGLPNA